MAQNQEEVEKIEKENQNPAELGQQATHKAIGSYQVQHRTIHSYDEMTDLIDLKKKLASLLLTWNEIGGSSSEDISNTKSPPTSYVSFKIPSHLSPQIRRAAPGSPLVERVVSEDSFLSRPGSSTSTISRLSNVSISPSLSSGTSIFSHSSNPTPSLEPRRTVSDTHVDLIDPKFLTTVLYEQLKIDRVNPIIIKEFIAALKEYLPEPKLIDTFVFPSSGNDALYNRIYESLDALKNNNVAKLKINCIRIVHEVILCQDSGESTDSEVFNELITCVRQIDFLLSTIKEHDDIVYPDSCPDSKTQKEYKAIITDLRGIVTTKGRPDFSKRQSYLIKVLIDAVQCGIFKLKQVPLDDDLRLLIKKLESFRNDILRNNLDGQLLSWIASHKKDPYLSSYQKELVEIRTSLEKAIENYGNSTADDPIVKCLDETKCNINDIEHSHHDLDPRTKLAIIYAYIKNAEAVVANKCLELADKNTPKANKDKYVKALDPLTKINRPQECDRLTTKMRSAYQATSSQITVSPSEADKQHSTNTNNDNVDSRPKVDTVTPALQEDPSIEKLKTTASSTHIPSVAFVAEQTSLLLTDYVNKDKGFFGLFNRSSSDKRLKVANGFRIKVSSLLRGNSEQLIEFIGDLNQTVDNLSEEKRNPTAEFFKENLPFLYNFIFGKEIRLLTTLKKIKERIEKFAENDPELKKIVTKATSEQIDLLAHP